MYYSIMSIKVTTIYGFWFSMFMPVKATIILALVYQIQHVVQRAQLPLWPSEVPVRRMFLCLRQPNPRLREPLYRPAAACNGLLSVPAVSVVASQMAGRHWLGCRGTIALLPTIQIHTSFLNWCSIHQVFAGHEAAINR